MSSPQKEHYFAKPSKLIGMYTKAKRWPTSSLVKVYSEVPADTKRKSLHRFATKKQEEGA